MVEDSRGGAGTVLDDVLEMLTAGIEAREKLPRAWGDVSRLVVLTREGLDRRNRLESGQRRELHLPAGECPPQNGGAVISL